MFAPTVRWLLFCTLVLLTSVAQAREWQDSTGTFKLEAELLGIVGVNVKLQKLDGGIIEVPLVKLSAKDQAFVKEWQTAKPQAALIAKLADKDDKVRYKALYDLMQMKLPPGEVLPHLIKAAESSDMNLADAAIHYLSQMGAAAQPALPALERLAAQTNENIVTAGAKQAIMDIRYRLQHFQVAGADLHGIAVMPDGKSVIVSSTNRGEPALNLWDLTTGKKIRKFTPPGDSVAEIAITADGKQLAVATDDKTQILDPATGDVIRTLTGHSHIVGDLVWSRDQTLLASTDDDKQILIHDAAGKLVKKIAGHRDTVTSLIFTTNGKRVISAAVDDTVFSWDIMSGKPAKQFEGYTGTVSGLAVTSDNKRLAAASTDGSVTIWDTASNKILKKWQAGERALSAVIFSPDNQILVTSGEESEAKAWDATTGKLLMNLPVGAVRSWAFDNSGERLIAGSGTGFLSVIDWKEVKSSTAKK